MLIFKLLEMDSRHQEIDSGYLGWTLYTWGCTLGAWRWTLDTLRWTLGTWDGLCIPGDVFWVRGDGLYVPETDSGYLRGEL